MVILQCIYKIKHGKYGIISITKIRIFMIKKLVKYGNSQALVLDKALLEILNISEATKLKLSTDGTSLTITPMTEEHPSDSEVKTTQSLSISESEAEMHYKNIVTKTMKDVLALTRENKQRNIALQHDFKKLTDDFNERYNYGQRLMELTHNQLFKEANQKLAEQGLIEGWSQELYQQKRSDLLQEFMPDVPLKEWQKNCMDLEKNYAKTLQEGSIPETPQIITQSPLEAHRLEQCEKTLEKMLEHPESWQQMQWDYQQIMHAFNIKYNYNERLMQVMNNPEYKHKLENLNQQAITEKLTPMEHAQKVNDLMQSFMPEIPLQKLKEHFAEFEKQYAHIIQQML